MAKASGGVPSIRRPRGYRCILTRCLFLCRARCCCYLIIGSCGKRTLLLVLPPPLDDPVPANAVPWLGAEVDPWLDCIALSPVSALPPEALPPVDAPVVMLFGCPDPLGCAWEDDGTVLTLVGVLT
jgi:hypothetical protein